jgi:membrane protease YdiL (CAAX protease family)
MLKSPSIEGAFPFRACFKFLPVYQRSGRIEVAIVAHAGLNVVHITFFTYPMLG